MKLRWWVLTLVVGAGCGAKQNGTVLAGDYECTTSQTASTCASCSIPTTTLLSLSSEGDGYTLGTYWSGLANEKASFSAVHDESTQNACAGALCCNAYSLDTLVFNIDVDKLTGTWMQVRGSTSDGALCEEQAFCVCAATIAGFR